jgi:hypothetical protein
VGRGAVGYMLYAGVARTCENNLFLAFNLKKKAKEREKI